MARFGAALGQGFIDAGGPNVTISLQSRMESRNTSTIINMVIFGQFLNWSLLAHCLFGFRTDGYHWSERLPQGKSSR
jgi:26S proteasome regulatory subunit N2